MVIGIIGAGISGLTAGRLLARAGHEVTIFDMSDEFGGRLATHQTGPNQQIIVDHGVPLFKSETPEFQDFTAELIDKKIVKRWPGQFLTYDGEKLHKQNPHGRGTVYFTAENGMNSIAHYLSRWVDIRLEDRVIGLTYFGMERAKKRSWIINFTSSKTFEADAVIIALPAPQAYGILSTTRDETQTLKIGRKIDDISYRPAYSLMAGYNDSEMPVWNGIFCRNSRLDFISNEGAKRKLDDGTYFVLHASESFSKAHRQSDEDTISRAMIAELSKITGNWATLPDWHQLHFWQYQRSEKVLDIPFFELEDEKAPLALIGDYFEGNDLDYAYRSGYLLAKKWS